MLFNFNSISLKLHDTDTDTDYFIILYLNSEKLRAGLHNAYKTSSKN